ncbi:MAG: iron-containing alcohol dehydrogenase family protein [candidate division WOR-3 bacterium]
MAQFFRNIAIPLFLEIEAGILKRISEVLRKNNLYFQSPLIVADRNTFKVAAESMVSKQVAGQMDYIIIHSNTIAEVKRVRTRIQSRSADVVIGVGGGKVIDVAKFAASEEGVNFLSVPTAPSHDGIASPVAVINTPDGLMRYGAKMPLGVIVDLAVIKQAPLQTIYSGFGDLISNITAVEDWNIATQLGKDRFDSFAAYLATTAAQVIMNDCPTDCKSLRKADGFLRRLVTGLVLSGIAMAIAGSSRPCSGAEHLISHALDSLLPNPQPHGIQVGIATIFTCALQGGDWQKLKSIFAKIGFPTSPQEVKITKTTFLQAVKLAPNLRTERYTILNRMIGFKEPTEIKEYYYEVFDEVFNQNQDYPAKEQLERFTLDQNQATEKTETVPISDLAGPLAL